MSDTKEELPLVSVLMTAYNREQFIAEAIESVLASSYTNFELIIVDDSSVDNTVLIARSFSDKDKRVKVFVNAYNLGQFPNRNIAASYAKGKYIKYLDSDDTIDVHGLAYCVESMEKYPEAGIGMYFPYYDELNSVECWSSEAAVRHHFFTKSTLSVGPTGTILNREKFVRTGMFDVRFGVPSDMFFNIKFASLFPVVLMPRLFVNYRRHSGQEINNKMDYLIYGYLYLKELYENESLPLKRSEIKFLHRKTEKRHAVNLLKYLFKERDFPGFKQVITHTDFSYFMMVASLFK